LPESIWSVDSMKGGNQCERGAFLWECAFIFVDMKALRNISGLLAEAGELENAGKPEEAAAVYQRVVDADPANQAAVGRLLVIYRRRKEYKKELAVIEGALAVYGARDKAKQEEWVSAHPGAAKVGKAFLKTMGGSAFDGDPMVGRLVKRKEFVEKRLGKRPRGAGAGSRKAAVAARKAAGTAERKREAAERRGAAAAKKAAAVAEAAARKAAEVAAKKAAIEVKMHPSLFVITLRYLVPLDRIDAAMKKHVAFLDKHFDRGDFLVAGRQVPRTGGIIIARGKDRRTVERIMNQDPLVKGKMAGVDIVEFVASRGFPRFRQRNGS